MTLMHRYVSEVLGLEDPLILAQPTASEVWTNFSNVSGNQYFTQVPNTPTAIPPAGAVMIFKPTPDNNNCGHICIVLVGATISTFKSLDADYPWGSKPHVVEHSYTDSNGNDLVYGWLIPKNPIQNIDQVSEQLKTQIDATSTCQAQLKSATDQNTTLQNQLNEQSGQASTKIITLNRQLDDLQSKYDAEQEETITLNDTLSKLTKTNKDYAAEALAATQDQQNLKDYLYAIADKVKIKRNGVSDADITEYILQSLDIQDSQLKTNSSKIQSLQTKIENILSSGSAVKTHNIFASIVVYAKNLFWQDIQRS